MGDAEETSSTEVKMTVTPSSIFPKEIPVIGTVIIDNDDQKNRRAIETKTP